MVSTSINSNDPNALLVSLCVKVLSSVAPEGMTTKELAAELDKEVAPGFNGISSSILSSKLNAVFRRSHNDSHEPNNDQLAELPLTRSQSSEVPRRLVYKYSPPSKEPQPSRVGDTDTSDRLEQESKKRSHSEEERSESEVLTLHGDEPHSSGDHLNEPLTPSEEDNAGTSAPWPVLKSRKNSIDSLPDRTIPKVGAKPQDHGRKDSPPRCPDTPPTNEFATGLTKAQALMRAPTTQHQQHQQPQLPKVNLYYDMVGLDTVTSTLTPAVSPSQESQLLSPAMLDTPRFGSDLDLSDYSSPESLGLSELDKLVC